MAIKQLGYLHFEVSDLDEWERFGTDILGMQVASRDDTSLSFRIDDYQHRIFLTEGELDDLKTIGLEVADSEQLADSVERLKGAGIEVVECSNEAAASRSVEKLCQFRDPTSRRTVALYYGAKRAEQPFQSRVVQTGFVTGDQGLGHGVIRVKKLAEAETFWTEVMGFGLSDHIVCDIGGYKVNIAFLHTNPRHHSIALGENTPKRIHHFLLQVGSLDDVGACYDRVVKARYRITQTLGRHPNDKMVSFYAKTPSGFEFEYGWGARTVDPDWEPTTYDHISEWGHMRPPYPRPKKP